MRYVGSLYRPPSEADALILQATIGCSWNNCTYCAMYRDKPVFRLRPLAECLEDLAGAAARGAQQVEKVFVADGDALCMPMDHWGPILEACRRLFPRLRRVSCYATADNVIEKGEAELRRLREGGLRLLYMGPESGDEQTLRRIAKGPRPAGVSRETPYLFEAHVEAARLRARAGLELSAIFLLGAGGVARSEAHARGSAALATAMDPEYLSALTLTVVPGTPLDRTRDHSGWELPGVEGLLCELRTLIAEARPRRAVFRTNHASNYLPLAGVLPEDGPQMVHLIDRALAGGLRLRPEWARGL
ncbi:MAG: radical SAM protein [Deltaproteobacteria bacterium]|nr:radical SAM protein [Deltaproteobacteria bacterium]